MGLGQFADLRDGLAKERGVVFLKEGVDTYRNVHYARVGLNIIV